MMELKKGDYVVMFGMTMRVHFIHDGKAQLRVPSVCRCNDCCAHSPTPETWVVPVDRIKTSSWEVI